MTRRPCRTRLTDRGYYLLGALAALPALLAVRFVVAAFVIGVG